jgi:hypothetical protein
VAEAGAACAWGGLVLWFEVPFRGSPLALLVIGDHGFELGMMALLGVVTLGLSMLRVR